MKRLVAIVLLAGLASGPTARAADPAARLPAPTAPSVPAPVLEKGGAVLPAAGVSRVVPPIRERVANPLTRPLGASMPLPTGYQAPVAAAAPAGACPTGDCGAADCGPAKARGACLARFKAWLCFRPTTGDALPKFNPHPYVGPITGTFGCTSAAGCAGGNCGTANGCAAGAGCATGGCRKGLGGMFGGLFGGRGGCVPPGDDAFPGYHFATDRGAAAAVPPAASTSYKPAPVSARPLEPQSRATPAEASQKDKSGSAPLLRRAAWPSR